MTKKEALALLRRKRKAGRPSKKASSRLALARQIAGCSQDKKSKKYRNPQGRSPSPSFRTDILEIINSAENITEDRKHDLVTFNLRSPKAIAYFHLSQLVELLGTTNIEIIHISDGLTVRCFMVGWK